MTVKKKTELEQLISDVHSHSLNYHTREIYLHGEDEDGVEYKMATTFIKNLHILTRQNVENILVHMHVGGGSWNDGMAVYNAIRFAVAPVSILSYAQASSMSGVILQAADRRVLVPDCEFLIHHGSLGIDGNSMEVKSAVDSNEKARKRMLQVFARRAKVGPFFAERNYSESKIKAYIDRKIKDKSDWYMPAEEAIYYGFADFILGDKGCETMEKVRIDKKYKGIA